MLSVTSAPQSGFPALPAELRVKVYKHLFFTSSRRESRGLYLANRQIKAEMEYEYLILHAQQFSALPRDFFDTDIRYVNDDDDYGEEVDVRLKIDSTIPKTVHEAVYPKFFLYVDSEWSFSREELVSEALEKILRLQNIESFTFRINPHHSDQDERSEGRWTEELERVVSLELIADDYGLTSPDGCQIHANRITIDIGNRKWESYRSYHWDVVRKSRCHHEVQSWEEKHEDGNKETVWEVWSFLHDKKAVTMEWHREETHQM